MPRKRTLFVDYVYLKTVEVPADATNEEIYEILEKNAPADGWSDIQFSDVGDGFYVG